MNSPINWTRREVLAASAGGLASIVAGAATEAALSNLADKVKQPGWIDAHSHIWTRDVKSYPLAKGKTVADLDPPSFTTEELIKVSEKEGVSRVVLIQHHLFYGWDNTYMTDAAKKYPGRFRVVGMVDDTQPKPDEAMKRLLKQHVTGFRITSWIRGKEKWLEGPGMNAMWKCGAETRQAMCCLIDPADLPTVDAMCKKHPETPVVIDHFARIGVDGKIRDADVKRLCKMARHKNTHVKISAYYALGKKKPPYLDLVPMIRRLFEAYGPRRLMWASDSPYQLVGEHTYKASIQLVRDRLDFVSKEDREWLMRKTAEKVYFFNA
ncbi:MAG: amidohydrolase family protein [Planctomycetaceae bacterium]